MDLLKMNIFVLLLSVCMLFYRRVDSIPAGPIGAFIQTNFVGFPVLHEAQQWIFDPDVALRRRKDFIELNGDKGIKLIERFGLGIDGYTDERLKKQRERDEGHLGGLNSLKN